MKTTKRILVLLCLMVITMGAWAQTMTLTLDPYPWDKETTGNVVVEMDLEAGESNIWTKTASLVNENSSDLSWRYSAEYTDAESKVTVSAGFGVIKMPKNSTQEFTFHATINPTINKVLTSYDGISLGIGDTNTRLLTLLPAASGDNTVSVYLNIRGAISLKTFTNDVKSWTDNCLAMNTQISNTLMVYGSNSGTGELKNAGFTAGIYQVSYNCKSCVATFTKVDSYTLKVTSALVSTLCFPCDATIPEGEGIKAYTLKYDGGEQLTGTKVTGTLPANTPVLIDATSAGNYSFELSEDCTYSFTEHPEAPAAQNYINDVTSEDNDLIGVMQPHRIPNGSYVLQNGGNGPGFYKVNTNYYKTDPFRCYITLPAEAHSLSIVFDDGETTGIADVRGKMGDERSDIFNLSGQRVGKDYKGVVIKNGRKMIQK